jgi:MFS superfamily sulfate permease-like transporter
MAQRRERHTDLKKDLRGVGFGNLLCGLVGALPMIAEIVRSTANVKYGATNKWSNFFHGICLLVMITVFRDYLERAGIAFFGDRLFLQCRGVLVGLWNSF